MPRIPSTSRRRLLLALTALLLVGPSSASAAPIGVRLVTSPVPLTQAGAEVQVVAADRRASAEGGADPDLLGLLPTADGALTQVRSEGPDPAFAVPGLVLDELRAAGFPAAAERTPGAFVLEVELRRFWVSGVEEATAGVDVTLTLRVPGGGRAVRQQRVEVWGTARTSGADGARAAIGEALVALRRELATLFESQAFEATLLVDAAPLPTASRPGEGVRRPGYAMDRRIGLGWGGRFGLESVPERSITEPQAEFLSFELRLIPAPFFSFDWVVDLFGPLVIAADRGGDYPLELQTTLLAHFSVAVSDRASVAVAPGMHFHVIPYDFTDPTDSDAIVYFAFRLGADLASPGRDFGFGIYLRPMIGGAVGRPDDGTRFELYAEFAWTIFAGPWKKLRRR